VANVRAGTLLGTRGRRLLTTEVWTARGFVTYYTAFVLDVQSRRVQVIGCTPYPDEAFVIQCLRQITGETCLLREGRILLCDRDPKWSGGVGAVAGNGRRPRGSDAGVRRTATPSPSGSFAL